jgi:hypothetical protein
LDTSATVIVVPESPDESCVAQPVSASAAPPVVPARKARRDSGLPVKPLAVGPGSCLLVTERPVVQAPSRPLTRHRAEA